MIVNYEIGDDVKGDGSEEKPFKTIDRALKEIEDKKIKGAAIWVRGGHLVIENRPKHLGKEIII